MKKILLLLLMAGSALAQTIVTPDAPNPTAGWFLGYSNGIAVWTRNGGGLTNVSGTGSQTPWTSDINGALFSLTNVFNIVSATGTNSTKGLNVSGVPVVGIATNVYAFDVLGNMVVGSSMPARTTGSANVGFGTSISSVNAPFSAVTIGSNNVAMGRGALGSVTVGAANAAFGRDALTALTNGVGNTAMGDGAMGLLTNANYNTGFGNAALSSLASGGDNVALGDSALFGNVAANGCVGLGKDALYAHKTGDDIIAIGRSSMINGTSRTECIGIGANTLLGVSGADNVMIGHDSGFAMTSGADNTAVGRRAMLNDVTGSGNVAIGSSALYSLTNGGNNIAIGQEAMQSPNGVNGNATTSGSQSIAIGMQSGQSSTVQNNQSIALGFQALYGADNATALGGKTWATNTSSTAVGNGARTTADHQVMLGTSAEAVVAPNTLTATNGVASFKNNKSAPTAITVGASVFNYTNTTAVNIQVFLDANGATTAVSFNGTTIFGSLVAGDHTIIMQPGDRIGVTYSVATPVMNYREF